MSGGRDQLRQQIADVLIRHAAFPSFGDGGFIQCACRLDLLTISEHADHVADEVMSASISFFAPPW